MFSVQIPKNAEEIDLRTPTSMSYVYSGAYTPLSCKLVEMVSLCLGNLFLGIIIFIDSSSYLESLNKRKTYH